MLAIRAFSGHFSSGYPAVYYKNRNTTPRCVTEEGDGNVPVGSLGPVTAPPRSRTLPLGVSGTVVLARECSADGSTAALQVIGDALLGPAVGAKPPCTLGPGLAGPEQDEQWEQDQSGDRRKGRGCHGVVCRRTP